MIAIPLVVVLALFRVSGTDNAQLEQLLGAVARYVETYEPQLSAMVAEEDYLQTVEKRWGEREEQRTVSDFLFLKLPGALNWVGFRDVLSVDGERVREPEERFRRIVQSSGDVAKQAAELAAESAQYNLGPVVRTINVPTLVLGWLAREVQPRFAFTRRGQKTIAGIRCRVVSFSERETPTIVRGRGDMNVPSSGSFCATADGQVLVTDHQPQGRATVTVIYRFDPQFQMLLPSEMREKYGEEGIECVAKYSKYRRFSVTSRIK